MRDDPWLSDEQQEVWRAYLRMTRELEGRIERDLAEHAGMPLAYYQILVMLSAEPGGAMRMSRLARAVLSSQSRLSHAIARLTERGWVARRTDPCDGRGQLARLTAAGFARLVEVAPGHAETVRATMFDPLSAAQLAALDDVLRTILDGMEADEPDAAGRG